MAAVFFGLRLGTECEVLLFLLVELTLHSTFDLEDSLPGCWGDQGSSELALRRTSYS